MLLLDGYAVVVGGWGVSAIGIKEPAKPERLARVNTGCVASDSGGRLTAIGNMHCLMTGGYGVCVLKVNLPALMMAGADDRADTHVAPVVKAELVGS